ncbi:MAG: hypothetical protein KC493_17005 [Bacteriovoracaceae bacterium]|nr:hypothetical protein [Bacteriovoracaceae bacterium]
MKKGKLKHMLQMQSETLRQASQDLEIDYYRLSAICNGWLIPKDEEMTRISKLLGISCIALAKTLGRKGEKR